jgi:glycerate dehydrogenase
MDIVILDKCTVTLGDVDFSEIEKLGNVRFYDVVAPERLPDICRGAEMLICNKAPVTRGLIAACPRLRYIGLFATGYNNIDLDAASERGIVVSNAPGYSTDAVAQLVFAYILTMAESLPDYTESVRRGDWIDSPTFSYFNFPMAELSGKTLGIFGFGAIGRRVADIAAAFGMKVLISTRTRPSDCKFELVGADDLFRRSDFLTLHCPLTPQTAGLINDRTLSLMKPTARLINTSRGGVVDEAALRRALDSGRIAGAALDVLSSEPMSADNPLYKAPNCLITPHIGWAPPETRRRLVALVADNMRAFIEGRPQNTVNNPKG